MTEKNTARKTRHTDQAEPTEIREGSLIVVDGQPTAGPEAATR
jgi:hypothetical protein